MAFNTIFDAKILARCASIIALAACLAGAGLFAAGCSQQQQQPADSTSSQSDQKAADDGDSAEEDDGAAAAKGTDDAFVKELAHNNLYKKYDVTGDGKADKLIIETTDTDEAFKSLTVKVNGKDVLTLNADDEKPWYSIISSLVVTSNGKSFLDLECIDEKDTDLINGLYEFGDGKLDLAIDYQSFFGAENGWSPFASVKSVKENDLKVTYSLSSYLLGSTFSCEYVYTVSDDGKVTLKDQTGSNIKYEMAPGEEAGMGGYLTTTEDLQGAPELGGSSVVKIEAGTELKPVATQVVDGVLYVQFKQHDDSTVWICRTISDPNHDLSEETPPFEGLM